MWERRFFGFSGSEIHYMPVDMLLVATDDSLAQAMLPVGGCEAERDGPVHEGKEGSDVCLAWARWACLGASLLLISIQCPVWIYNERRTIDQTLTCPATLPPTNDVDGHDHHYTRPTQEKAHNFTNFIKNYRTTEFDAWTKTYEVR
jgi:hypothetical protein